MNHGETSAEDAGHDVTLEDLAAFASGTADKGTHDRVRTAMLDIRHPLSYLIRTEEEVRAGKPPSICVEHDSERTSVVESESRVFQAVTEPSTLAPKKWQCPPEWIEEGRKAKREQFEQVLVRNVPLKIRVRLIGALNTPDHPVVDELRSEGFPLNEVRSRLHLDDA